MELIQKAMDIVFWLMSRIIIVGLIIWSLVSLDLTETKEWAKALITI